jgi:outer membrane biosynthesis protein TonB
MFTNLTFDSSVKPPLSFLASLCLQSAVLVAVCCIPPPPGTGAYLRSSAVRTSEAMPIYFQKAPEPAAAVAEVAKPEPTASKAAPELPQAKPAPTPEADAPAVAAQDTVAQAGATDDGSADGDGQAVAPFPQWRMNAMSGFAGMHHMMKTALPVFTPDPPILHGEVPELARGKDVVMQVVIDDHGSIVMAQVMQGVGYGVEQSIVETLRRWIFVPAKINGVAISSQRQLTFHLPG